MIFRTARSASGKHSRGKEAPPSAPAGGRRRTAAARAWLTRTVLLAATLLAGHALWMPAKAALAQQLLAASWQQARQDGDYAAFVGELHRRLDAAGAAARFESGMHPVVYWPGAAIMAAIGGGLLFFLAKVIMNRDFTGALVVIGVMALFAWQVGTIFYRNRPRSYRPDDLPRAVMPKA